MRLAGGTLAVTLLMVLCAACSGNADVAEPSSSPEPTTSAPPTSASPTVPPYLEAYSADERTAYAEAVAAYEAYVQRNNRFLAKGETTTEASDFYHRFSTDWVAAWANLAQLANNHVTVTGSTTVKRVRPAKIELASAKAVVVLLRCLDESKLVVAQNGQPLDQPNLKEPHVYRVRVEKRAGETWWRSGIAEQGKPCVLNATQFLVGDDEEVARPAGRIENLDRTDSFQEGFKFLRRVVGGVQLVL